MAIPAAVDNDSRKPPTRLGFKGDNTGILLNINPTFIPPKTLTPEIIADKLAAVWCDLREQGLSPAVSTINVALGLTTGLMGDFLDGRNLYGMTPDQHKLACQIIASFKEAVVHNVDLRLQQGQGGAGLIFYAKARLGYSETMHVKVDHRHIIEQQVDEITERIMSAIPQPGKAIPADYEEIDDAE